MGKILFLREMTYAVNGVETCEARAMNCMNQGQRCSLMNVRSNFITLTIYIKINL